ncbi:MAG: DUF4259 domain-containing protein [Planctomycetaceae bacterium]|nr:DUF4259 domain-containing protein [Planctomycetaceae bacterium]
MTRVYSVGLAVIRNNIATPGGNMGAWAEDALGNDAACDWISLFLRDPQLRTIGKPISAVLCARGCIPVDTACNCLAACEVIARLQGQWGLKNSYSRELDSWIESNPIVVPDALKKSADSAIDKILGPDSELAELWDEGGYNETWHDSVADLQQRIFG